MKAEEKSDDHRWLRPVCSMQISLVHKPLFLNHLATVRCLLSPISRITLILCLNSRMCLPCVSHVCVRLVRFLSCSDFHFHTPRCPSYSRPILHGNWPSEHACSQKKSAGNAHSLSCKFWNPRPSSSSASSSLRSWRSWRLILDCGLWGFRVLGF